MKRKKRKMKRESGSRRRYDSQPEKCKDKKMDIDRTAWIFIVEHSSHTVKHSMCIAEHFLGLIQHYIWYPTAFKILSSITELIELS